MRGIFFAALLLAGCGLGDKFNADGEKVSEEVQKAIDNSPEQQAFLEAHPNARTAIGSWTYDVDSQALTLHLATSDIECKGLQADDSWIFAVLSVSATTMATVLTGESNVVTWQRDGAGTTIEGSWVSTSNAANYMLTLLPDGALILSFDGTCDGSDGEGGPGYFEDERGCWVDVLTKTSITIDGAVDDWGSVTPIEDVVNDSSSSATGDEIKALYVAESGDYLVWRISFAESISTGVQGGGDYNIGYETENDLGSFRIRYENGSQTFAVYDGPSDLSVVASDMDIEVQVLWSSLGGRASLINTSVKASSDTPGADPLDQGPCFSEYVEP